MKHDEHHGVQAVGGVQRASGPLSDDRARHHKGQHGADGAAGQDEVHQLRRGHFGLQGEVTDDRRINGAGEEARSE